MKTHVIHVITKLELGGAQEVALYTVANLDPARYDATLITGEEGYLSPKARSMTGVGFIEIPQMVRAICPVNDLIALYRLRAAIRRIVRESDGPVIVHTHSSKAGILGRWAGWLAGADVVMHSIHGYGFNEYMGPLKRRLLVTAERLTAMITDAYTADSRANVERGRPLGLFEKAQVEVIHSGIPVGHYRTCPVRTTRAGLGLPEDGPVVMMVSCLKPQKAPLDFVRLAAVVTRRVPSANFVQVGDGELRGSTLAEADRLGLKDKYRLLGWREDVRELMHASDVIVLTSLWEGLPLVIPMAMAAGKPVVATDVDGNPEAVEDGVTGYIVGPHDIDGMADRVMALIEDPALALRMGRAGEAAVEGFDLGVMLGRIENLYDRLIKVEA